MRKQWFEEFFGEEYLKYDHHDDTEAEVSFVIKQLGLPEGARVLDLCCGYGRHAIGLAKRGYRVTGYDLSPVMLEVAHKKALEANLEIEWIRDDMRKLDFDQAFDATISMFTSFGYFEDESENFAVLKRITRALIPGGRLLIETVNRDFLIRHFVPYETFEIGDITVTEERDFDLISSRSRVRVTMMENGRGKRFRHSIRVYTFTELEMLMAAAGLQTIAVWGDFEGGEYTWNKSRMIILSEKR